MKRFSGTDLISNLSSEKPLPSPGQVPINNIKDNSVLRKARINDAFLNKVTSMVKEKGFASPIYVVKRDDYYEVIYPRFLYKAAKKAKIETIPCVLMDISDEDILLYLASRLLQDKNGNIVEMSLLFNKIKKQMKYSQKEIASAMGLSRSQVTNIMRLIDMPEQILDDVVDGKLSFGHVRAISTLEEPQMTSLVQRIYEEHLSVHDVEKIVYELKHHVDFKDNEKKLEKNYQCEVVSSPKRLSFIFNNEEEKEKFIDSLLKR